MFKKAIKYIGYGFCGFNMGMTSALTPVIFLPALLIAGIDKMGNYNLPIPMLITVIICVIAAVAYVTALFCGVSLVLQLLANRKERDEVKKL